MAEALAIIGLVSAIVQFIDAGTKVLDRLQEFRSKAQEFPGAFRDISNQIPLLIVDLQNTKAEAEAGRLSQGVLDPVLAVVKGCQSHIEVCYVFIHHDILQG